MASRKKEPVDIDLRNFAIVGPLLAHHARKHYGTCASFCFRQNRPRGPIVLDVDTGSDRTQLRVGLYLVTKAIRATLGDPDDAAEHGAYGVALLTAAHSMGLRFIKRSFKGPGFDFYVTPPGKGHDDPDDIFANEWGFEVSGIFKGDARAVRKRLGRKRNQVSDAARIIPVLVAVVEFSRAVAIFKLQSP